MALAMAQMTIFTAAVGFHFQFVPTLPEPTSDSFLRGSGTARQWPSPDQVPSPLPPLSWLSGGGASYSYCLCSTFIFGGIGV
jgi:hypothetical protein